jgi:hypothetical protein
LRVNLSKKSFKELFVKTIFLKTLPLLILMFLSACGQKQNTKTLKVSTSFALSNSGFTGGLVVRALGPKGQKFSANATTGTSLNIPLVNGTWTFWVSGWDGAGAFAGKQYCGTSTFNLGDSDTTVNMTVTEANCANAAFSDGETTTDVDGHLSLRIYACESLYDTTGNAISSTTATTNFSTNFCNVGVPIDGNKKAGSARLVIPGNLTPGVTFPALQSTCYSFAGNGEVSLDRMPLKHIPIIVNLYDSNECSGSPLSFPFLDGIKAGSPNFDSVVNTLLESNNALFLPYNELRRGFSPTIGLLPDMKCGANFCVLKPTDLPSNTYYLRDYNSFQKFLIHPTKKCSDLTLGSHTNIIQGSPACVDDSDGEEGLFVVLKATNNSACVSGCSLSYTLSGVGSGTITVATNTSYAGDLDLYNHVWRLLGNAETPNYLFDFYYDSEDKYGSISHVRETLMPGGPLSLFGATTCSSMSGTKEVTLFEDGQYKKYQVEVTSSSLAAPYFVCNNTAIQASTCTFNTFDKKITLRQLVNQIWTAREVMHISCTNKAGISEAQFSEPDGTLNRTEKVLMAWNTQTPNYKRFEEIKLEAKTDSSNVIHLMRTSNERVEQLINSNTFIAVRSDFESKINTAVEPVQYEQRLNQQESFSNASTLSSKRSDFSYSSSASSGSIFSDKYMNSLLDRPHLMMEGAQASNANGDVVRTWIRQDGGINKLYVSTYDASTNTWTHPPYPSGNFSAASGNVSKSAVHIKSNGDILVTWIEQVSMDKKLYYRKKVSGTWGSTTLASVGVNNSYSPWGGDVSEVSICGHGNNVAIIWTQMDNSVARDQIYLAMASDSGINIAAPTVSSQRISDSAFNNSKPECAFNSNGKFHAIWIKSSTDVIGSFLTSVGTTLSVVLSSLASNRTGISSSGGTFQEAFIGVKSNNDFLISYFNSNTLYSKTFSDSLGNWGSQASRPARFNLGSVHCRNFSNSFPSSSGTCMPPTTYYSFTNSRGVNNWGWRNIDPTKLNSGFFTPWSTFKSY